jgi:ABC-type Zn uptake system ZnuABC Zn-binding protein ZnuA
MYKLIIFSFILINLQVASAVTYSCSHPELCRMGQIILNENKSQDINLENIIVPSGDPHEFEPSIHDIKNLIQAPNLLVGPVELNPWIKNISYQRTKEKNLKTVTFPLPDFSTAEYPTKESEALGHFWLYPKIYCHFKKLLSEELKFKNVIKCNANLIENNILTDLKNINMPIILTHDALLPLLQKLATNKSQIIALKGSTHHGEVSAAAVKKVYDGLKSPKVIWILENNIATSENIKSKIRSTDIIIKIDTAKSINMINDFSILELLHEKLKEIRK